MSKKVSSDDASVLLYIVPFLASAVYGIYLGVAGRVSALLSPTVYLDVTRDPVVFLVGTLSVMLGVALEASSASPASRPAKLGSLSNTLQTIAAASFVLAIIGALYANGFLNVSGAATDLLLGRFGLVFPFALIVMSYLITARFDLSFVGMPGALGLVSMLLVPVSIYEIGKRNIVAGLAVALVLMIAGVYFFLMGSKKDAPSGKPSS